MLNSKVVIPIVFLLLCLVLIIVFLVQGYWYLSLAIVAIVALFIYITYRKKRIWVAMMYMQQGNTDKAMEIMNSIKNPDELEKSEKSVYYTTQGSMLMQEQKFNDAEKMFSKAMEAGFSDVNQEAMVYLQIAGIHFQRRNVNKGKELVLRAKKIATMPTIIAEIKKVEAELKKAGIQLY